MTDWIEWNGGECPIKSHKTRVVVTYIDGGIEGPAPRIFWRWNWEHNGHGGDIIAYRIIEDHEPKMTRKQIKAQIEALQKQLDALPVTVQGYWGGNVCSNRSYGATHYFDIETINGVPHIHGIAMKEVTK